MHFLCIEFTDNLRLGEKAHERPGLYMKMDAMLDDIESGDVFGQISAYCAVVEFHLLITISLQ